MAFDMIWHDIVNTGMLGELRKWMLVGFLACILRHRDVIDHIYVGPVAAKIGEFRHSISFDKTLNCILSRLNIQHLFGT